MQKFVIFFKKSETRLRLSQKLQEIQQKRSYKSCSQRGDHYVLFSSDFDSSCTKNFSVFNKKIWPTKLDKKLREKETSRKKVPFFALFWGLFKPILAWGSALQKSKIEWFWQNLRHFQGLEKPKKRITDSSKCEHHFSKFMKFWSKSTGHSTNDDSRQKGVGRFIWILTI